MRTIKFTKDYGTIKKDHEGNYSGMLASRLVRELKVAKYTDGDTAKEAIAAKEAEKLIKAKVKADEETKAKAKAKFEAEQKEAIAKAKKKADEEAVKADEEAIKSEAESEFKKETMAEEKLKATKKAAEDLVKRDQAKADLKAIMKEDLKKAK